MDDILKEKWEEFEIHCKRCGAQVEEVVIVDEPITCIIVMNVMCTNCPNKEIVFRVRY